MVVDLVKLDDTNFFVEAQMCSIKIQIDISLNSTSMNRKKVNTAEHRARRKKENVKYKI
jgi:hypothetical protein